MATRDAEVEMLRRKLKRAYALWPRWLALVALLPSLLLLAAVAHFCKAAIKSDEPGLWMLAAIVAALAALMAYGVHELGRLLRQRESNG